MVSICVPTYEMRGLGKVYLLELLDSLQSQSNNQFEVIISDDSLDDGIYDLVKVYRSKYPIHYYKHTSKPKNGSKNLNNAIRHANYDIIKPIFQDDFIVNNEMISEIVNSTSNWGCFSTQDIMDGKILRTISPYWNDDIIYGINTISGPSVIYFKKNDILFDENLVNLMDVDFYYRLYKIYGLPNIHNTVFINTRVWSGSVSNSIVNKKLLIREERYIIEKYSLQLSFCKKLKIRAKLNYTNVFIIILFKWFKIV